MIHKISHHKVRVSTGGVETRSGSLSRLNSESKKYVKKSGFWGSVRMDSGWLRVARGGSACRTPRVVQKLAGWGVRFLMVYKNNASRLGSCPGFINVCLETRLLGQNGGFCVPEWSCNLKWTDSTELAEFTSLFESNPM